MKNVHVFVSIFIIILMGCSKKDASPSTPPITVINDVYTDVPSSITATSVLVFGSIGGLNADTRTAMGFVWGEDSLPTVSSNVFKVEIHDEFKATITGLQENTTYHVRAYVTNSAGTSYGNSRAFTTTSLLALVQTTDIYSVGSDYAIIDGKVLSEGNAPVLRFGVCWSTNSSPTVDDDTTIGDNTGYFGLLNNLTVNIKYYARTYATNSYGTSYGDTVSFTTAYQIGQYYQGGQIFSVDETKLHGLIAAPGDFTLGYTWLNGLFDWTYAWSDSDGQSNTNTIIAAQGVGGYAAYECTLYYNDGYSDWFLPSISQLDELYKVKDKINGLTSSFYWSSTERSSNYYFAWGVDMGAYQNEINYHLKSDLWVIRAVRAF